MTQLIASSKLKVVVGIGTTGLSVARHLSQMGERFVMLDTRMQPPCLEQLKAELPEVPVALGELAMDSFDGADEVVLSPGLSRQNRAIQSALKAGISVISDIELFARAANAPIVAITGSNGKSTVTTLLGEMCIAAGVAAGVGGNLGVPALALLDEATELYVLELSSFQLESVYGLNAEVATVLNISPDHMDRYNSLLDYHQAKHRIFNGTRQVVVNREDKLSVPLVSDAVKRWSFGLDKPDFGGFGLLDQDGEPWLSYQFERLMPEAELGIKGRHNTQNALAALALGSAIGLPMADMLSVLRQFRGLSHRCQTVKNLAGVTYINDSKATNVGATLAAIRGLAGESNLVLIAGGQGKGQDFSPLANAMTGQVKQLVLLGEDAVVIDDAVGGRVPTVFATSLQSAVEAAQQVVEAGDVVLLSPACASFDMFSGFEDRGEQFAKVVGALR
ncbi:MAG TPA: UDP-N-acetylmuramoyl-L-alanine--D-glutamate ligase [Porticoccus sp.]|nr:UDP-N-acetylmuramoyl-L-alanine--D-glutamate ligase [Porticoccus sp.]